jgi:hypothetical protein
MSNHNHPGFACLASTISIEDGVGVLSVHVCVRTLADPGNNISQDLSELVESVQGGHFVSLGQRGIVKDHIAEVFD